ncbi:MAG: hypothetical protein F4Y45_16470 [Acidobacteria bacterium]|nr:hypothetical protein [Acidobacteriota bacterium]MXZ72137.1 hypothetical protein [Acidobacteriota bacterium]MYJ05165.1 hypothetical protein [Acidobacteriota bacterium]
MLTAATMDDDSTVGLRRIFFAILLVVVPGLSGCTAPTEEVAAPEPSAVETMAMEAPAGEPAVTEAPDAESVESRSAPPAGAQPPRDTLHLRVAWTRDVGDGTDFVSLGDRLRLMTYDSLDGIGERSLLPETASFAKPLIAPSGDSVVFTMRRQGVVYAINWDGSGLRRVAEGFGLDVWSDPTDGVEWAYVGVDERPTDPPSYPAIRRYRLDDPSVSETVWDAQPVSGDSFQLSADGRTAAALLPWPSAGVIDFAAGTWRELGEGCWTAFSPGRTPLCWFFDGAHRNVTVVNLDGEERWTIPMNDDPRFGGYEVYHPRWTNDPRAIVLTGPYSVGTRVNKIRAGGRQVEVHVGILNESMTAVESWRQVTENDAADFYPDAWIAPGGLPAPRGGAAPATVADRAPDGAAASVVVSVRVREDVPLPTPQSISPYREGLLAIEYDVVEVLEGDLDVPVVAVAHWVIRDGETLADATRPAGETYRLNLAQYDARRELEGKRLVMGTRDLTLPLFYDTESGAPAP